MSAAEVEFQLRLWGLAYGVRIEPDADPEDAEPSARASGIARIAVDRTRERQVVDQRDRRLLVRAAPVARRRIQQQVGESCRVPSWAGGDPIRAPRQHDYGSSPPPTSPEAETVEAIVLELQRWDRRGALALRACYCLLGRRPLNERIAWVAEKSETKLTRTGYRAALARGRIHVAARLLKKTG